MCVAIYICSDIGQYLLPKLMPTFFGLSSTNTGRICKYTEDASTIVLLLCCTVSAVCDLPVFSNCVLPKISFVSWMYSLNHIIEQVTHNIPEWYFYIAYAVGGPTSSR